MELAIPEKIVWLKKKSVINIHIFPNMLALWIYEVGDKTYNKLNMKG